MHGLRFGVEQGKEADPTIACQWTNVEQASEWRPDGMIMRQLASRGDVLRLKQLGSRTFPDHRLAAGAPRQSSAKSIRSAIDHRERPCSEKPWRAIVAMESLGSLAREP